MTVVRSDPFGEVDRLLGWLSPELLSRSSVVPLDAYRSGDRFVIEVDLPGVRAEDTELTVESNTLTIKATRPPRDRADGEPIVTERRYGIFTRQLLLGDTLDTSRIEASFAEGVLSVTIPFREQAKPRRIEIGHAKHSAELSTTGGA